MIQLRPFDTLGAFRNEWLNAHHHFSFGGYHDTERMGLGRLRVWNDDEVAPGTGFDPHPHRDMEIVTFIREGAITHRDNLGNEGRTEAGDVQVMHAGTGSPTPNTIWKKSQRSCSRSGSSRTSAELLPGGARVRFPVAITACPFWRAAGRPTRRLMH